MIGTLLRRVQNPALTVGGGVLWWGEIRCGAVRVYLYYFDSFRTLMVHVMVHLKRVLFSQLSSQDIDARSGAVEQLRRY